MPPVEQNLGRLLRLPFFSPSHLELAEQIASCTSTLNIEDDTIDIFDTCRALARYLGSTGLLSIAVPLDKADDHRRHDLRSLCLARQLLAYKSGLLDFVFALQGLGSGAIVLHGTPDQKERYLTQTRTGNAIPAFALSESRSGSDVANLETTARQEGDRFVLDGEKTWISNAGLADFYVVFARTGEPGAKGISAFVVEADNPGLNVTEQLNVISPHPLGTLAFTNCWVGKDSLLGTPGKGFKVAMSTLDVFRPSVGAAALGFARRATDEAIVWTKGRILGGQQLSQYQATQMRLADMATETTAAELLVYSAAWQGDHSSARITLEAAMAKLMATEIAQTTIDSALQLFGGRGVLKGNACEALYREIRALRIYEGTSEIQKMVIGKAILGNSVG